MIKAIIFDFYGVIYRGGELDEDMLSYVKAQKKAYKTAVFSSMGRTSFDSIMQPEQQAFFDEIFLSGEIGLFKPLSIAYQYVINQLGVKPEECIFIDDSAANVQGAVEQNLYGIHFSSFDDLQKEIDKIVTQNA